MYKLIIIMIVKVDYVYFFNAMIWFTTFDVQSFAAICSAIAALSNGSAYIPE